MAAPQKASIPDRSNLEIVGHSDLLGAGKGGEGLALKEQDGKRYLYLAHESGPQCFSIVDVTNPSKPTVLKLGGEMEFFHQTILLICHSLL